jgi:hypothetical protein
MSASPNSAAQAAAETLAALDRYQLHVSQLAGRWLDAELYRTVSADLEAVRRCCQQLPALSAGWVSLLIAHAELMHALWQASKSNAKSGQPERQRLLDQVQERVRAIHTACMTGPGAGGAA